MKLQLFGYNITLNKDAKTDDNMPQNLRDALAVIESYGVKAPSTLKQQRAAATATKARSNAAKEKIENAVNMLRMQNKNITQYSVAKMSGCSINTVKKYKDIIPSSN